MIISITLTNMTATFIHLYLVKTVFSLNDMSKSLVARLFSDLLEKLMALSQTHSWIQEGRGKERGDSVSLEYRDTIIELWLSPRKDPKNGTYPSPPYHQMRPVLYYAFICLVIENHCCINFKCAKHGKLTLCLTHITLVCGSIWKFLKMPPQPLLKIF